MPRKSITLTQPEIETQEELRAVVGDVAADMITASNLRGNMEAELAAVRARFEADLIPLEKQIDDNTELVATYATTHPDLFPKGARSLDLLTAVIGFRTGQPKVKVLKRWTLPAVIEALKARKWRQFIREVEELDKERIIAERAQYPDEVLKSVGIQVAQDERFYIEPADLTARPTQSTTETR